MTKKVYAVDAHFKGRKHTLFGTVVRAKSPKAAKRAIKKSLVFSVKKTK